MFYTYIRKIPAAQMCIRDRDCTKVDRSAAYAARYVAKNLVAAGLADKCEIQLSYAIGVAHPTSVQVETFGTGKLSDEKLTEIVRENFDLRPAGIIKMLDLSLIHICKAEAGQDPCENSSLSRISDGHAASDRCDADAGVGNQHCDRKHF